jgi:hypothetical protein
MASAALIRERLFLSRFGLRLLAFVSNAPYQMCTRELGAENVPQKANVAFLASMWRRPVPIPLTLWCGAAACVEKPYSLMVVKRVQGAKWPYSAFFHSQHYQDLQAVTQ